MRHKPCRDCPFLSNGGGVLLAQPSIDNLHRAALDLDSVEGFFPCHHTTGHVNEGGVVSVDNSAPAFNPGNLPDGNCVGHRHFHANVRGANHPNIFTPDTFVRFHTTRVSTAPTNPLTLRVWCRDHGTVNWYKHTFSHGKLMPEDERLHWKSNGYHLGRS